MTEFSNYLSPGRKGHLIGIGGVSMSSLAEVLCGMGIVVTGSDMNNGPNLKSLIERGIPVALGHRAENIGEDVDFVVRTAAVHDDNPEIIRAHEHGIPVFERTQAWGAISKDYANALCISGTHGKTTTTSMCTHILMAADRDPTVMIGGTLPLLNAGHRVGHGNTIIMEACEYYNSFLSLHPTVAVILNVEADHLTSSGILRMWSILSEPLPPVSRRMDMWWQIMTTGTPWTPSGAWTGSFVTFGLSRRRMCTRKISAI